MTSATRESTTIRIPRETHERLKALAAESGQQIAEIVARAVDEEARRRFMQRYNEAYARLKADPAAWAAYRADLADWDVTLGDGLDPNDDWSELLAAGPDGVEFVDADDEGDGGHNGAHAGTRTGPGARRGCAAHADGAVT